MFMKNSKTIVFKRQQAILKALKEKNVVHVENIAQKLNVSATTVRRDLQMFEQQHLVERFHGGAKLLRETLKEEDSALLVQSDKGISQKHIIAKYAASLIEEGDTVFLNSSSTALLILDYLKNTRAVVVTNNGNAIGHNKDSKVELIITGGEVYERKQSMVGDFALHTLSKITADKAFIGVSGISVKGGITTSVLQETAVNEMMLKRCQGSCYIVAANFKIGKEHNFLSGAVEQVSEIITVEGADKEEVKKLKNTGIDIVELANIND